MELLDSGEEITLSNLASLIQSLNLLLNFHGQHIRLSLSEMGFCAISDHSSIIVHSYEPLSLLDFVFLQALLELEKWGAWHTHISNEP